MEKMSKQHMIGCDCDSKQAMKKMAMKPAMPKQMSAKHEKMAKGMK